MFRFTVKAGLATAGVYYIHELGVWKDSQTTKKLSECIKRHTCPYINQAKASLPFELPTPPKADNISQLGKGYWNCGVKSVISFLLNIPTHCSNMITTIGDKFNEFSNAPSIAANKTD